MLLKRQTIEKFWQELTEMQARLQRKGRTLYWWEMWYWTMQCMF